jgi:hypothetical protein
VVYMVRPPPIRYGGNPEKEEAEPPTPIRDVIDTGKKSPKQGRGGIAPKPRKRVPKSGAGKTRKMGNEFTGIVALILAGFVLCSIIIGASYLFAVKKPDGEKISVYECGFDPYGDSRQKFEVRFFLVGILFIIFDLEISFLFP